MNEINIGEHSCALFERHESNSFRFVGSAFFFIHAGRVLAATADHCVAAHSGLFELVATSGEYQCKIAERDTPHDLCLLEPLTSPADVSMSLANQRPTPSNLTLYTYEFSTTGRTATGWHVNPATRIGNCVRMVDLQGTFGPAGEDMLELSFPALWGASGAPVVELRGGAMLFAHGIIVANTEHHLLPAHIETVLDTKNELLEERKYFLPQGVAVNAVHLVALVERWLAKQSGA